MFTLRQIAQDIADMQFCESCKMNVFPTRPKFNIKIFGIFIVLISVIIIPLIIIFIPILSGVFIFLFFFFGFMLLNPYLLIYAVKKKVFCPLCYQKVVKKNLDYQPFGEKEPEAYKLITSSKKSFSWYCPHCGNSLIEGAKFCSSCGKKFEIQG
ncbi:MAG: zinc ribbon domain-containing protein [Candidatus Thorarchaeota archaeon]